MLLMIRPRLLIVKIERSCIHFHRRLLPQEFTDHDSIISIGTAVVDQTPVEALALRPTMSKQWISPCWLTSK